MSSYDIKKSVIRESKETLLYLLEFLKNEPQFQIIMLMNQNKSNYTFDDLVDKLKISNSKNNILNIVIDIICILYQHKFYIENFNYQSLKEYLYKNCYQNSNTLKIEPNFGNNEINSGVRKIAIGIIDKNKKYRQSLAYDSYDIENTQNSFIDIYKNFIDLEINIFNKDIPKKILHVINIAKDLIKQF
jgi:hypothetical protein